MVTPIRIRNMARLTSVALHSLLADSFIHLLMNSLLRQKRLVAASASSFGGLAKSDEGGELGKKADDGNERGKLS